MVKLEDPTLPFADLIPRRRRERAGADGQAFRLGAPGYDWRGAYAGPGSRVVIAASQRALSPADVEGTVKAIGTVGGLLADMGFQVFPAKALTNGDLQPSLLVWVGAGETAREERDRLDAIGAPGVSVGSSTPGIEGWRHIDLGELDDWRRFTKRFVSEVAGLVEVPESAYVSNNLSNGPRRTGPDDGGPPAPETPADLHEHGRRRTRTDPPGRWTAGS